MISNIYNNIGKLIQHKRKNKNLSQLELSELLDINRVTLARIESGNKKIFFDDLVIIMNSLDIGFSELEYAIKQISVEDEIGLKGLSLEDQKKLLESLSE